MRSEYEVVVIGQGLAGTAVAWWLRWSGTSTLVVDRETDWTSSKVAAGLMTPITGQKLVKNWIHDKLWPVATEFYRRVEQLTGTTFFREVAMVRLLKSPEELSSFERRLAAGEYAGLVRPPDPMLDLHSFSVDHGAFEMQSSGQLNVNQYLEASRESFRADGGYLTADLDVSRDLELLPDWIEIPRLDLRARRVIFCQGIEITQNPWFRELQFKPAKGEILGLKVPGLLESRIVHGGVWLAPMGDGCFKAGSTYDWEQLDHVPTARGREEILTRLDQFLKLNYEVVSHQAAVRPIHRNQFPVLGRHPLHRQLACLNGLGSKGSLHAPYFARQLVAHLIEVSPIDLEVDMNRKTPWLTASDPNSPTIPANSVDAFHVKRQAWVPLTDQAQAAIRASIGLGDVAIDATAGNGHDTQFLAQLVGPTGRVYAFDIQAEALLRTATRLADHGLENVLLLQRDHGEMAGALQNEFAGRVAGVMFNLGYLPGGDKRIITNGESTRSAIYQAATLLREGGIMTILSYTGHDGGAAESQLVELVLNELSRETFDITTIESQSGRKSGPRLFIVRCQTPPPQIAPP